MKTTVDIPDELATAAKKRAAELHTPMRNLIIRGLRAELVGSRAARKQKHPRVRVKWVTVEGGLPEGLDIGDRAAMHEWLGRNR
jgi:hypothetical protein